MVIKSNDMFLCPQCQKKYKWNPKLAGHKVKCSCGATLRLDITNNELQVKLLSLDNSTLDKPISDKSSLHRQEPQTYELNEDPDDNFKNYNTYNTPVNEANIEKNISDEDIYELDFDEEDAPASPANPSNQQARIPRVNATSSTALPDNAVGASETTDKDAPEEPAYVSSVVAAARREEDRKKWAEKQAQAEHRKINVVWPTAMLIIGSIIILITAFAIQAFTGKSGIEALVVITALEILVMTPLLILALFIAASMVKIGFGDIKSAAFKAIAINTGPGALADIISIPLVILAAVGFLSMMVGPFIVYLILIGIPLSKMFELDFQETAITIIIIVGIRLAGFLLIFMNVYHMLPSVAK